MSATNFLKLNLPVLVKSTRASSIPEVNFSNSRAARLLASVAEST